MSPSLREQGVFCVFGWGGEALLKLLRSNVVKKHGQKKLGFLNYK